MSKKPKFGRGLDALLGGINKAPLQGYRPDMQDKILESQGDFSDDIRHVSESPEKDRIKNGELADIPVDLIRRGKYQPRRDMDTAALEELANSIKAQGIMQPIVVRPVGKSGDETLYEIIAGERRWRACQIAGLDRIPALVRDVPDSAAMAMALIENIQRENLNAMEESIALNRLKEEFALTHNEVADSVGKSRAAVSNLLRLMTLHPDVQKMLERGDLDMGHARALLALTEIEQHKAAREVIEKSLSVREAEALVRRLLQKSREQLPGVSDSSTHIDPDIRSLQNTLSEKIGAPVHIQYNAKGRGKLVISYNSLDELDGILGHIK